MNTIDFWNPITFSTCISYSNITEMVVKRIENVVFCLNHLLEWWQRSLLEQIPYLRKEDKLN